MLEEAGVELVPFHSSGYYTSGITLCLKDDDFFEIYKNDHDIIMTGSCGLPEYPMTQIKDTPIVQTIHYVSGVDNSYNISRVLHISEFSRDMWLSCGGDEERVEMISHPISIPEYNKINIREKLGIDSNVVLFGMHQRDNDRIYSPIPLYAYKLIEDDEVAFCLLGGSKKYREQAEELGLQHVYFLDSTDDNDVIYSFLEALDVYAHGRMDGELNSTALAEAMAFSLPIITSPSQFNGHLEVVKDNGFIASGIRDYAEAMIALKNEELRKTMGEESLRIFEKKYEMNEQMNNIMRIFDEVLEDPYPNPERRKMIDEIQQEVYAEKNGESKI